MVRLKRTTVNLTYKAQAIKDRLTPGASLKGVLSVALEMFDALTSDEQKERVQETLLQDVAEKLSRDAAGRTVGATRKRGRPPKESAG